MAELIEGGRRLRANHSTAYPSRWIVLDTETRPIERPPYTVHTFVLGWTLYRQSSGEGERPRDEWKLWHDPERLCIYLDTRVTDKKTLYIYGHNVFFDLQACGFMHHFPRWGWKLDFLYDKGLTFILCISKGSRHIKCVSTTNYYEYSLAQLGTEVGIEKGHVDFGSTTLSDLAGYCRTDVRIASAALDRYMEFNRAHDTGKFALTRASQSFAAYRHRFLREPITIHDHEGVMDLERRAYFGGRTECFELGTIRGGPFLFMDVNSMYPFVMRTYRYPRRLILYEPRASVGFVAHHLQGANVIADVRLSTPEPAYALRQGEKVIFPVGTFRTTLGTAGLEYALMSGHLKRVYRAAVYECGYLFRDYVDAFYPLKARYKAEGNRIYTRITKIFLNSLYGKWGQKEPITVAVEAPNVSAPYRIENLDTVTGQRWMEYHLFGRTIFELGERNGKYSLVAIAAEVTERARFALWSILSGIGIDRCLYCDTDSVVLRAADRALVRWPVDPGLLGALSVDRTSERLVLHGLKDYQTDAGRKTKGVPRKAQSLGADTYRYDQFLGSVGHLRERQTQGVLMRAVVKKLTGTYDKGTVRSDGRVVPFVYS